MTSWPFNADVRSSCDDRLTLIDLADSGTLFGESARWIAVTLKPAAVNAVKILDPRFPVAWLNIR